MLVFDKDKLYEKMVNDLNTDEISAAKTLETLVNLDNRLQPVLDKWMSGENANDFNYDGISLAIIQLRLKCDFIDSLYSMDTLINDDEKRNSFKDLLTRPFSFY
jgi:hypothetical protein